MSSCMGPVEIRVPPIITNLESAQKCIWCLRSDINIECASFLIYLLAFVPSKMIDKWTTIICTLNKKSFNWLVVYLFTVLHQPPPPPRPEWGSFSICVWDSGFKFQTGPGFSCGREHSKPNLARYWRVLSLHAVWQGEQYSLRKNSFKTGTPMSQVIC